MSKQILIIGASGHGKVVADIAEKNGYTDIAFLDDNQAIEKCGDYPIIGTVDDVIKYSDRDIFVAIGNASIRKCIQNKINGLGLRLVSLIHPCATVASSARIGIGTVIMAGAVVNPYTTIGDGCIVNTNASVDHDNNIGDYVHISVGCHLAGTVNVGDLTWLGIGSIVSNNISICDNCMIGAGAVVVKNIDESGTYVGVPANKITRGGK